MTLIYIYIYYMLLKVVDWIELLSVVEPILGKIWAAKLENAPEYEKFTELHWETVGY